MPHKVSLIVLFGLLIVREGVGRFPWIEIHRSPCEYPKECVPLPYCKNRATISDGRNFINFETIQLGNNRCPSLHVCCSPEDRTTKSNLVKHEIKEKCFNCGCSNPYGVEDITGTEADHTSQIGEFPWVVRIVDKSSLKLLASGSLITPSVVLTKAHNIADMAPHNLQVRAGEWDTRTTAERYSHEDMNVFKIEYHSKFNAGDAAYNVALLILENAFEKKPNIRHICLANEQKIPDVTRCIVSGWGKKNFDDINTMDIQKKITVPLLDNDKCQNMLRRSGVVHSFFEIPESVLCAGGEKDEDSCTGDGGGPLFCSIPNQPNRYEQVGIVNWGAECGHDQIPALYTNVSFIRPWIVETLRKYSVDPNIYTAPNSE